MGFIASLFGGGGGGGGYSLPEPPKVVPAPKAPDPLAAVAMSLQPVDSAGNVSLSGSTSPAKQAADQKQAENNLLQSLIRRRRSVDTSKVQAERQLAIENSKNTLTGI